MPGKRILWLASWYPSRVDSFNGDFIQRHAVAASLKNDIHVIHIIKDDNLRIGKSEQHVFLHEDVCENIIYYNPGKSKLRNVFMFYRLMRKAINENFRLYNIADAVHVHVPWKMGIIGIWVQRVFKIPMLVSEHWGIYNEKVYNRFEKQPGLVQKGIVKTFKRADVIHSVSRFVGEKIKSISGKDFQIIPNVANTNHFYFHQKTSPTRFRFLHVSSLIPLKNVEGIIRAVSRLLKNTNHDFELRIVGGNSASLRKLVVDNQLQQHVHFIDTIPYEKVAEEMQNAHAFILFSEMENSPCVISEALCCGMPVIATAVGGIPELVNENNGMLVNAGDEQMLSEKMGDMITQFSKYDRRNISIIGKEKFSYEVVSNQFNRLYEKVLGS